MIGGIVEEVTREGFAPGEEEHIRQVFAAWRAHQALEEAPELLGHVRSLAITATRPERGDTGGPVDVYDLWEERLVSLAGLPDESSPLRITAADAADELYAQLVNWVVYWAEELRQPVPSTARVWSSWKEPQGFRAGTTAEGAVMLARVQTMWLLARHDLIVAAKYGPRYVTDVTRAVWELRARFPMKARPTPTRPVQARPCPLCKGDTVRVDWYSEEDQERPAVSCSVCGWMPVSETETMRILRRVAG